MEGKWTYADLNGFGWVNPSFDTKEEAITEAKRVCKDNGYIVVGQLSKFIDTYYPENQEYVKF